MALNDILPSYVEPCVKERSDSDLLSAYDNGEFYSPRSRDSQEYPSVTPVYNGKPLNIRSNLVHASLSGISIKHYYGKCYEESKEVSEDEEEGREEESLFYEGPEEEVSDYELFNEEKINVSSQESIIQETGTSGESGSSHFQDSVAKAAEQPTCMLPRINFRNSFWNIHRPELCKLTWGQKYVSSVTVIDHLHNHLTYHGIICDEFHTEEDRIAMLNRELDEYVRLKVLACPRQLPPDEPEFNVKQTNPINPRCKIPRTFIATRQSKYMPLKDDEEIQGRTLHRSKEEFCLTIGKYVSKPIFIQSTTVVQEDIITPELSLTAEEEELDFFSYNWLLYGEEALENGSVPTQSGSTLVSDSDTPTEPCPPLMLDDFCRAAGKADFSDLRCNPDF